MPDSRFFSTAAPVELSALALLGGARLVDLKVGDQMIAMIAPLGRADGQGLTFFSDKRYLADLKTTRARACFISEKYVEALPDGCAAVLTENPQGAFVAAAERLYAVISHPPGGAPIHPTSDMEVGVVVGPGVVIGPGAKIGRDTVIGANAVIGPGVSIGRGCRIGANATIGFALIGDRVRILSGAVIGEQGFGVAAGATGAVDIPQLGRVIIQDGVTVGANSCVDRGAWDDTVIGENTKIDNFVQIGHNVVIGRNCALAAHTGLSGSVTLGDGVQCGGRVGIADHLTVGAGARLAAGSGVMHNVPDGETWCGVPARPIRQFMRETAWLSRSAKGRTGGGGE